MTPEEKKNFIAAVDGARELIVRAQKFGEERKTFFADVRSRGMNRTLVKEIAKRYESDDPLSFSEYDEKLNQAIEIYAKSEMAQKLLRTHVRNVDTETRSTIASTIPQSPPTNGNGLQATAADNASFPGDVSAANNSDTAAAPGEATAAVSAPSAKADDASVRTPRKSVPVFARYKNGAHA